MKNAGLPETPLEDDQGHWIADPADKAVTSTKSLEETYKFNAGTSSDTEPLTPIA